MMSGYGWDHMSAWGWVGMTLMLLLWLGLIALGIWALVNPRAGRTLPTTDPPVRHDPARDALRERFARGEITADEYEQRRRVLAGH